MKKKTVWVVMTCLIAVSLVLAACKPAPPTEKTAPPEEEEKAGPTGEATNVVGVGKFELREAVDPRTAVGATPTTLKSMMFTGLVTKDEKGKLQPDIAKSWEIASDWSKIDFTLRKGIKFHNGEELTAEDVKFSLESYMKKKYMHVFGPELRRKIDHVEVVDDYHVSVYLKEPYPAFLDRCFEYIGILPKDYIERVGDKEFAANPVGAGPFKIIDFQRDVSLDAKAVRNHYRKTPYVDTLHCKYVAEDATRLALLETGKADIIGVARAHIPRVKKDPDLRIKWSKNTFCMTMCFFDLAHPEPSPFKDKRVRKAVMYALDLEGIGKNIGHGALVPWGSFLTSYHPGFDPERKGHILRYDPEKARELLAEAGYPDGFDTVLTCDPPDKDIFAAVQGQLREVGINCKLNVPEGATWSKKFVASKFRGIGYGPGPWWVGRTHPASALRSHIAGTWTHSLYEEPKYQKLFDKLTAAISVEEQAEAAKRLDDALLEGFQRAPMFSVRTPYGLGPRIKEYPGVPGVVFPMNFEYLKLKQK